MFNLESSLIGPDKTVRDAMALLNETAQKLLLVTNSRRVLLGTLTDGDIRRAILKGKTLEIRVDEIMNRSPLTGKKGQAADELVLLMRERNLNRIPIVDDASVVVSVFTDRIEDYHLSSPVVIMAGGLGQRLRPLTDDCPKPMLPIAGQPILERTLIRLIGQGFSQFHVTINYLGEQIVDHFGDGRQFGVSIAYVRETTRLGTAGALTMLKLEDLPDAPVVVMNGDLLTDMNFTSLIAQHRFSGAEATMCVSRSSQQIPYGVVKYEDGLIRRIDEKPSIDIDINAGIYCLSKQAIERIPHGVFFDMPSLFNAIIEDGGICAVHHLNGLWLDIGSKKDYEHAQLLFEKGAPGAQA